jgi:DNA-directed RNA polymerase specialized sigma24 family protein
MGRNYTPDETLVDRLLLDDTEAFEELHRRYCYSLYSYCLGKLNSPEDARQITRDIFIRFWESRHSLPVNFSVSSHLYHNVRRDVVNCLNEKLNTKTDIPVVEQVIIPGFAAINLKQARVPVQTATISVSIDTDMKKGAETPWWNQYPAMIHWKQWKQMRLALNKMLHLF